MLNGINEQNKRVRIHGEMFYFKVSLLFYLAWRIALNLEFELSYHVNEVSV